MVGKRQIVDAWRIIFRFDDFIRNRIPNWIEIGDNLNVTGGITAKNITADDFYGNNLNLTNNLNAGNVTADNLFGDGANITNIGLNADTETTRTASVGEMGGINKGQGVYIFDATGDKPRVKLADNQFHNNSHTLGVAAETGANGEEIFIRLLGDVSGIDTTMFTEGCRLHLASSGNMSCDVQVNGSHIHMGFASKINANTGIIEVTPDGYVHDTQGTLDINVSIGGFGIDFMDYNRNIIGWMATGIRLFNWSGDLELGGNLSLSKKITFGFGETIDNLIDGMIRINGNFNVTGKCSTKDAMRTG